MGGRTQSASTSAGAAKGSARTPEKKTDKAAEPRERLAQGRPALERSAQGGKSAGPAFGGAAGVGRGSGDIWQRFISRRVCGVSLGELGRAWDSAKSLFDYTKTGESAKAIASDASAPDNGTGATGNRARISLAVVLLAGIIIFAISLLTTMESIEVANFASDTMSELSGTIQPKLDYSVLLPVSAYQFLLYIIVGTLIFYAHEGIAFAIARLTGGRGTLGAQLYAASVAWLAVSFSLAASLLVPLPCLVFAALLSLALVSLVYLMVYSYARLYSEVHGISFMHSLAIVLLLIVPTLAVWALATNFVADLLGLSYLLSAGV